MRHPTRRCAGFGLIRAQKNVLGGLHLLRINTEDRMIVERVPSGVAIVGDLTVLGQLNE